MQWWTSTRVKSISTRCASLLCSSSVWVSSCCCYRRTGTSASSSSAQSCANVMSRQRAVPSLVPPQGWTGEGEAGHPCLHLRIDSINVTVKTHKDKGREAHLFCAAPWVKKKRKKKRSNTNSTCKSRCKNSNQLECFLTTNWSGIIDWVIYFAVPLHCSIDS